MTSKIRARVMKLEDDWLAVAHVDGISFVPSQHRWAQSHPEAMQAAHKLIVDLDAKLMDEVHASRASRRQAAAS